MKINERLKILRVLSGQSQQMLADVVGAKQASIASYESGSYSARPNLVEKLAEALLTDPAYLAYGYPAISGNVWFPVGSKGATGAIEKLLPLLLEENSIKHFVSSVYTDGISVLFSAADGRKFLLFSRDASISNNVRSALTGYPGGFKTYNYPICLFQLSDLAEGLKASEFIWPDRNPFSDWKKEFVANALFQSSDLSLIDAACHIAATNPDKLKTTFWDTVKQEVRNAC